MDASDLDGTPISEDSDIDLSCTDSESEKEVTTADERGEHQECNSTGSADHHSFLDDNSDSSIDEDEPDIQPHSESNKPNINFQSSAFKKRVKQKMAKFDVTLLENPKEYQVVYGGEFLKTPSNEVVELEIEDPVLFFKEFNKYCAIIEHRRTGYQTVYCKLHPPGPNPKATLWKSREDQKLFHFNRTQLQRIFMTPNGFNRSFREAIELDCLNRQFIDGFWVAYIPDLLFVESEYAAGYYCPNVKRYARRSSAGRKPKTLLPKTSIPYTPPTLRNSTLSGNDARSIEQFFREESSMRSRPAEFVRENPRSTRRDMSPFTSPRESKSSTRSDECAPSSSYSNSHSPVPNNHKRSRMDFQLNNTIAREMDVPISSDKADAVRTGIFWSLKTMQENAKYSSPTQDFHDRIKQKWTSLYDTLVGKELTFSEYKSSGFERVFGFILLEEMEKAYQLYLDEVAQQPKKRVKTDEELLAQLDF